MKKTLIFAIVIISLMASACKSTPKSAEEVTDETFTRIYNSYVRGLILDGARSYTVKSGDSLASIARAHYPDGHYYPVIMLASNSVISDPYKLQVGMVLTIPDLQANLNDSRAKRSIKGVMLDCAHIDELRGFSDTASGIRAIANSL